MSENVFIHPSALVETESIGDGTRVWAFAHVMKGARIGGDCNVGDHSFVESGVTIGDDVTIKNGVSIWEGVDIGDKVFIGPNAAFTKDIRDFELVLGCPARHAGWVNKAGDKVQNRDSAD